MRAIDINKGRLRILTETAKVQNVDGVVATIHADLRAFAVISCPLKSLKFEGIWSFLHISISILKTIGQ